MAELKVGDGEEAAGRPAGGSKTLAAVEMERLASWRPRDVELWPEGAERGRRLVIELPLQIATPETAGE